MARRVTDYWPRPRVFTSRQAYMQAVVYPCDATNAYWDQAAIVLPAYDKQYYAFDEFIAEYGTENGKKFWEDARRRARADGDLATA